jgi:hypothetical protein
MANNTLQTAVSSSFGVTPKPINTNNAINVATCTQQPITSYITGVQNLNPNDPSDGAAYTQWISVGMRAENTDACQQIDAIGPSCATVCARRSMRCNPCAMKASTTSFAALIWALTQAGNNAIADACGVNYAYDIVTGTYRFPPTKEGFLAFLSTPQASAPWTPTGQVPGWNGEYCGTLPENNMSLFFCEPPNYDIVLPKYGYADPCQVPTWTRDYTTLANTQSLGFPGATSGALCYCESAPIGSPP